MADSDFPVAPVPPAHSTCTEHSTGLLPAQVAVDVDVVVEPDDVDVLVVVEPLHVDDVVVSALSTNPCPQALRT